MTLNQAIDFFGSKSGLAKALNIGRPAVTNWGDTIPESRQFQIEVITEGKLKAEKFSNRHVA